MNIGSQLVDQHQLRKKQQQALEECLAGATLAE